MIVGDNMKNKIIYIILMIVIIGVVSSLLLRKKDETIIMLDINPSIEITADKNEKVTHIVPLNDDAKKILIDDYINKSLDEVYELMILKLVEKGYVEDNNLEVVIYSEGLISSKDMATKIEFIFGKSNVHTDLIIIDNITNEDKELAKKYNVSPAKIAYINSIENENINKEDLSNKSVKEITETKKTGKYCDEGYVLENDKCYKEKERVSALQGSYCPSGYKEFEGKCYEVIQATETDNYVCPDDFKLVDNKCISENIYDAKGICEKGDYRGDGYCYIMEYYGDAKEYCRLTPSTDLLYNGRCLGRKPTINGKCLGSDKLINGYCYDTSPSSGYKADWICPDGSFITNPDGTLMYKDKKCYHETKTNPISYYCDGDGELDGKKCKIKTTIDAIKERKCPNGYKAIEDSSRCLNLQKTIAKENGLVCNRENSKLKGNVCIIYEVIDAKQY